MPARWQAGLRRAGGLMLLMITDCANLIPSRQLRPIKLQIPVILFNRPHHRFRIRPPNCPPSSWRTCPLYFWRKADLRPEFGFEDDTRARVGHQVRNPYIASLSRKGPLRDGIMSVGIVFSTRRLK